MPVPALSFIFLTSVLQQVAAQEMQCQPTYMPVNRQPHVRIQSSSPHCNFPASQPVYSCNQHCCKPRCCPIYNAQPCHYQNGVPSYCVQSVVIGGREDCCCCQAENKTCSCQKRCDGQQTVCCRSPSNSSLREKEVDFAKNEEYFIRLIKSLLNGELRKRNRNYEDSEDGYSPLIVLDEEEEEEEPSTYIIKHRPGRRGNRRRILL